MEYTHKPVLLDACIQALNIRPDGIYVDGTLDGPATPWRSPGG